jgi:hypothetical protein
LVVFLALSAKAQKTSIVDTYPPMKVYPVNLFLDQTSKQIFNVHTFDSLSNAGYTIRIISQLVKNDTSLWVIDIPDAPKLLLNRAKKASPAQLRTK